VRQWLRFLGLLTVVRAWRSCEPCYHSLLVSETVWCSWDAPLQAPRMEAAPPPRSPPPAESDAKPRPVSVIELVCVNPTQVCVNPTQVCVNRTQVCVDPVLTLLRCVNPTQVVSHWVKMDTHPRRWAR
jgi:hypothetical protein